MIRIAPPAPPLRPPAAARASTMWDRSPTPPVTVEVLDFIMLPSRGRLQGLALVEVILDGVAIILQGVRILRQANGLSYVEPTCYQHTGWRRRLRRLC